MGHQASWLLNSFHDGSATQCSLMLYAPCLYL